MEKVVEILSHLEEAKIAFRIMFNQPDAISIVAFTPGVTWEIDVYRNGDVQVERFVSNGEIGGPESLPELFSLGK